MDTPETYAAIFKADYALTVIDDIVDDPAENYKIQSEIISIMPLFLDIFHIMQSRSKSYPMVDELRIKEDIINQIELTDSTYLIHHMLNNIVKETCV